MKEVAAILQSQGTERDACVKVLQEIQGVFGYLPAEALRYVTQHSQITSRQIHGVATFYDRFRFKPVGKHIIRTCHGTACHVNGAKHIGHAVEEALKIKQQETTPDGLFTLESVACLGCCSLAPVMMIDETVYGRLQPREMKKVLKQYAAAAKAKS
ncbi:MAG: NADH-quinone oxidoreductase subunit NuoE [Verrucomicrobia bacterium]|nr:NADH-quinone oxidoreductase subunit NuoE [Verrucomicrobiota bacterium]